MTTEELIEAINSLTPEQREAVRQFIDHLKRRELSATSPFLLATEEFIAEHPELF